MKQVFSVYVSPLQHENAFENLQKSSWKLTGSTGLTKFCTNGYRTVHWKWLHTMHIYSEVSLIKVSGTCF